MSAHPAGGWLPPTDSTVPLAVSQAAAADPDRRSQLQPAGWGERAAALILDSLITTAIGFGLGVVIGVVLAVNGGNLEGAEEPTSAVNIIFNLLSVAILAAYVMALMSRPGRRNGQTWGKQAMDIRVVRSDGQPVQPSKAFVREILVKALVPTVPLLAGLLAGPVALGLGALVTCTVVLIDCLWPLVDARNRALHDLIAGTMVTRTGRPHGAPVPSTVNDLRAGQSGYVEPAAVTLDAARGCWVHSSAPVAAIPTVPAAAHVTCTPEGLTVRIAQHAAQHLQSSSADALAHQQAGWRAAAHVEIV